MTQTNIDSLFQVIAQPTDRGPSATRTGGNGPGFDDHLSKASTSIYSPTPDNNGSTIKLAPVSQPAGRSEGGKTSECPAVQPERDETDAATASTSEKDSEQHSDDEVDEATAAAAGAAQPAASKESAQKPEPKTHEAGDALQVHAKDAVVNEKEVAEKPRSSAKVEVAKSNKKAEAATIDTALATAETQHVVSGDATVQPTGSAEVVEQSAESEPTKKPTKDGKRTVATTKGAAEGELATAEAQSNQITIPGKGAIAVESNSEQAPEGKPPAVGNAKAAAKATKAAESDADDNSAADKPSAQTTLQNDQGVSVAKAAAAAIANNVAADVTDASSMNGDRAKESSEKTVKAVSAKADPPLGSLDRLNRAASELANGTRSAENNDTPRVDPARFVGRVAKAFQTAHERGGPLQLRLSPPELGALRIQLTVKDGVMSAALETDNAGAKRVLLDNLPALRDRLAEQNIRIEKFDVDVRQEGNGGQANPHGSNQNQYQPQPDRNVPRAGRVQQQAAEVTMPVLPEAAPQISSSGINLFV